MNVETTLETKVQFSKTGKPGMCTLAPPAMVAESRLAFHAAAGNAGGDVALSQTIPAVGKVTALVCMQFARTLAEVAIQAHTAGKASSVGSSAIESCRLTPVYAGHTGCPSG